MGGSISYSSPPFFITCELIAYMIVMRSYIISPYMGDSPDIVKYVGRIPVHRYHDNEDVFSPMYTSTTMFQHAFLMNFCCLDFEDSQAFKTTRSQDHSKDRSLSSVCRMSLAVSATLAKYRIGRMGVAKLICYARVAVKVEKHTKTCEF
jgi:hypothetical protein